MGDVIKHEFGKEEREHLQRFCRLMGILEKHEADVLADPIKYLRDAGKTVADLKTEIFAIWEIVAHLRSVTMFDPETPPTPVLPERVMVDKAEYLALKEVYRRVAVLAGMATP